MTILNYVGQGKLLSRTNLRSHKSMLPFWVFKLTKSESFREIYISQHCNFGETNPILYIIPSVRNRSIVTPISFNSPRPHWHLVGPHRMYLILHYKNTYIRIDESNISNRTH